jgi:hypothetical protein
MMNKIKMVIKLSENVVNLKCLELTVTDQNLH